jgi:hypothetical protein
VTGGKSGSTTEWKVEEHNGMKWNVLLLLTLDNLNADLFLNHFIVYNGRFT